ncbi:purine-binding chemotaxis protein CheW [bacterium]|nr:purine-binding chemotaxis protein CheW [bacterium]
MDNQDQVKYIWHQWVCFKLGNEEFGVDILKVREIVRIQSITHVPQTPDTVAGVINLRGNVIPVIDLPKKLGLPESNRDDKARIIVFFVGDKLIGMIVDHVERVLRIRKEQIESPPDIGAGRIQDYIEGMGKVEKDLIVLLNIDKILTEEDIIQIEDLKKMKQATEQIKASKIPPEKTVRKPESTSKTATKKKTKLNLPVAKKKNQKKLSKK